MRVRLLPRQLKSITMVVIDHHSNRTTPQGAAMIRIRTKQVPQVQQVIVEAPMRHINFIVIHCTATPDYHPSDPAFDSFGAAQVKQWHTRPVSEGGRGWDDIGYHWLVRRSGKVEMGRPEAVIGAHVQGQNAESIGIAYVGTCDPTCAQVDALKGLIAKKVEQYDLQLSAVVGHNELTRGKTCPGFSVKQKLLLGLYF